jgi:hypothetical protein
LDKIKGKEGEYLEEAIGNKEGWRIRQREGGEQPPSQPPPPPWRETAEENVRERRCRSGWVGQGWARVT